MRKKYARRVLRRQNTSARHTTPRTVVLVSGAGETLRRILESGVPVRAVIANKACGGLEIAKLHGIPTYIVAPREKLGALDSDARGRYTRDIMRVLRRYHTDLVVMAGFMMVLHRVMFTRQRWLVINTHPALLPKFPGAHAIRDALAAKATVSGYTAHVATERVDDHRYILTQERVDVFPGDTEDTLRERIQKKERPGVARVVHLLIREWEKTGGRWKKRSHIAARLRRAVLFVAYAKIFKANKQKGRV